MSSCPAYIFFYGGWILINRNMELCVCECCVAGFYQSKEYWVTREDPYQVIKDECAFCQIRRGYDFLIQRRNHRLPDQIETEAIVCC